MIGEKFYSKSKLIRMGTLIFLLGGSIGGLTARLFPEPIKTTGFVTESGSYIGQEIHRRLGPNQILVYNLENNECIPVKDYLNQFSEEFGIKKYVKDKIIEASKTPKTKYSDFNRNKKPEKNNDKKYILKNGK